MSQSKPVPHNAEIVYMTKDGKRLSWMLACESQGEADRKRRAERENLLAAGCTILMSGVTRI